MKTAKYRLNRRGFLTICGGVMTEQFLTRNTLPAHAQSNSSTGKNAGESADEKKKELVEKAYKLGFDYLSNGKYPGCALCTLAAIQDTLNIRDDTVFKAASGMSGGGGGTGVGNCGSYTGCSLVIGQLCGCKRSNPQSRYCYKKSNGMVEKITEVFNREYGSVICRDIQVKVFGRYFDFKNTEEVAQFRKAGASEKCGTVVAKGAQCAVELILDEGLAKI